MSEVLEIPPGKKKPKPVRNIKGYVLDDCSKSNRIWRAKCIFCDADKEQTFRLSFHVVANNSQFELTLQITTCAECDMLERASVSCEQPGRATMIGDHPFYKAPYRRKLVTKKKRLELEAKGLEAALKQIREATKYEQ